MGAQLILGAQQILMVLGAQGAQTMNCTIAFTFSYFHPIFFYNLPSLVKLVKIAIRPIQAIWPV